MDERIAARLKWARQHAKIAEATEAARRFGWPVPTYLGHENASRGVPLVKARIYARAYRVNLQWLLTGDGKPNLSLTIPLSGYVGAGAVILPLDDGQAIDEVELPPGVPDEYLAFKVKGDSNYPAYKDGEIIYVSKEGGPPDRFLNRECVIDLSDGRRLLKMLAKGSMVGLFTLMSFNAPPIPDQEVMWASPVEWSKKP